jgi:serine/threonine-protein kinase RIO1
MKMEDLEKSVNKFLSFNEYKILQGKGKISHERAGRKAIAEYDEFNKTQKIESDFDREVVKRLQNIESKHHKKIKKKVINYVIKSYEISNFNVWFARGGEGNSIRAFGGKTEGKACFHGRAFAGRIQKERKARQGNRRYFEIRRACSL